MLKHVKIVCVSAKPLQMIGDLLIATPTRVCAYRRVSTDTDEQLCGLVSTTKNG